MAEKNPSEVARDTLRTLAARKLSPTPENFSALYHEISGVAPAEDTLGSAFGAALAEAAWLGDAQRRECLRLAKAGDWPQALRKLLGSAAPPAAPPSTSELASLSAELFEQIARLIEFILPALGDDDAKIGPDARALAAFCRDQSSAGSLAALRGQLANFNQRLSFVAEEQAEVRSSLLGMLRLVFENIAELSLDDSWLHAQIQLLMAASDPPLNLRRLDDLQRRLKDVIFKQGELKRRTIAAHEDAKRLLATFIDKLSEMAEVSGAQGQRIEQCARRIESARDIAQVGPALNDAISAARVMSLQALKVRDELTEMRRKVDDSESELARLRSELDVASAASRHDALTGALNRKGLDEAFGREIGRSRRLGSALAIALLDIDNFKAINDVHGHPAGDAALNHLAGVARSSMRAQDTLSRVGGEEFVVLMPDTGVPEGVIAMQNLQRELTRHYFMAGSSRLLITFSAGVAGLGEQEEPGSAIERADKAMYLAKRAGKNKVVAA